MYILEKTDTELLMDREDKLFELAKKSAKLEMRTNIPDPKSYSLEWLALAIEYSAVDAKARHDACIKRYEYYRGLG